MILRTSSSQEEGGQREFAILTKSFEGRDGKLVALNAIHVEFVGGKLHELPGTEVRIEADLCLLAMGFTGPESEHFAGIALDDRSNLRADTTSFATDRDGVFACGDARRGQSLVVWAIWEGREAARAVDLFLMGESALASTPANAA